MEGLAPTPEPLWPRRLAELCAEMRARGGRGDSARTEAWLLIRDALTRYLRTYAFRVKSARPEDIEDLAGARSLELIRRAESGEWNPGDRSGPEIAGYLAAVARNSLWRLSEQLGRQSSLNEAGRDLDALLPPESNHAPRPEAEVEAREFVAALQDCAGQLRPIARHAWFLRAFYDMGSRDIAAHPRLRLTAAHVDVLVNRARAAIRSCLESKGLRPVDYPTGTFSALWESMKRMDSLSATAGDDEADHAR